MHDVSGVTGAAPVWHDLMAALQQDAGSSEPDAPWGVKAAQIRYAPAVEPARREWFVGAAPANPIVAVGAQGEIARIDSPANGMIIAIDPDIPQDHQRIPISVRGAGADMRLRLNDQLLGAASKPRLWAPKPGVYRLTLENGQGQALDRILFTVRASSM